MNYSATYLICHNISIPKHSLLTYLHISLQYYHMFNLYSIQQKNILVSDFIKNPNIQLIFGTRDIPTKILSQDYEQNIYIEQNKKLLCSHFNLNLDNVIIPNQTHSSNIKIVSIHQNFDNCDSIISNKKNTLILLHFADCTPILLYDSKKQIVANIHAGWKGTFAKIAPKTFLKMKQFFNSNPQDIIALIGPCISRCCFKVQNDVKQKLLSTIATYQRNLCINHDCLDLKLINKFQLENIGITKIDISHFCTSCHNDKFFSYRKEHKTIFRHFALALIT